MTRPSSLPHPTSTQFLLLLLMLGAASLFAGTWWGVLTRSGWTSRREDCLWRAAEASGDPDATTRCLNDLLLRETGVALLGPATVLALAALAVVVTTAWRLRRWRRYDLPVPDRTVRALESCLADIGYAPAEPPTPVVEKRGSFGGVREEARAYGLFGRRYVVVAHHTPLSQSLPWGEADRRIAFASLRHEVAHLRAGDVGRGRFAFHALWVFPCVVVLPLAVAAIGRPANLSLSLGWRLASMTAVVLLAFAAFVRIREYEADAVADRAEADPGGMAFAVQASLAGGRTRLPEFLRLHPDDRGRLRVLRRPDRPHRLLGTSCLIAGTAVGSAFHEIALLLEAATSGNVLLSYWLTGLLAGTAITAVVSVSVWRDLGGTAYALLSGALSGLALAVGSQLSPRAAGAWERLFPTSVISGDNYALSGARPLAVLSLVVAAALGGAVFTVWSRALAPARSLPARGVTAVIVLGGLVLSVPLALWFGLQRQIATSYVAPREVARQLLSPAVFWALCATGVLALAVLWRVGRPRWRPALAVACVCAGLLPVGVVAVGTIVDGRAGPARAFTRPTDAPRRPYEIPEGDLPILPAPTSTSTADDPAVEPALACFLFTATPTERLYSPDGLEEVARRMRVTRDVALRSVVEKVLDDLESARKESRAFDIETAVSEIHSACRIVLAR
ncbi:M48 family metalloprotease [Streptomyces sp. NPDC002643]